MTAERKILTLQRNSTPEHQERTGETAVPLPRKKIRVEAKPNPHKKKKATETGVETTLQLKTAKNETAVLHVKEPTPIKPPSPKRTQPYDEAVSIMQVYWPGLFEGKQPRLLKINIREDLYNDIEQRELPLSRKVLRHCLKSITRSADYLSQIQKDTPRYNLKGIVNGHVNELEYPFAIEKLTTATTSSIPLSHNT